MAGRRSPIVEDLAQLLCLMSEEEDIAISIHGTRKAIPERRHWETLAEFMRDGFRQDARRIIKHLKHKLPQIDHVTDEPEETEEDRPL